MSLKKANYSWEELMEFGHSSNDHERRSAIMAAQNKFENYFFTHNITLKNGKLMDGVYLLVEEGILTSASLLLRLQSAIDARNQITHRDGIPTPGEAIKIISAYRDFLFQHNCASGKPKEQISTDRAVHSRVFLSENFNNRQTEFITSGQSVFPPPSVSYHPSIYIQREEEEQQALSCLRHPNNPVIIQAPALLGKRAFVSHLLQKLSNETSISVIRIDGSKIGSLEDFKNKLRPKCESEELDVYTIIKQTLALIKNLLILIIDSADATPFANLGIIQTLMQLGKRGEQPWTRLRILCTMTAPHRELQGSTIFSACQIIELEEFTYTQVEELAARHNLSDGSIDDLWHLVGGHPYLVRLGVFHAFKQNISFSQLIMNDDIFTRYKEMTMQSIKETYFGSLEAQKVLQTALKPLKTGSFLLQSAVARDLYKRGLLKEGNSNYQPRCLLVNELLARLAIDNSISIRTQEREIKNVQEIETQMLEEKWNAEETRRLEVERQKEVRRSAKQQREDEELDRIAEVEWLADARMDAGPRKKANRRMIIKAQRQMEAKKLTELMKQDEIRRADEQQQACDYTILLSFLSQKFIGQCQCIRVFPTRERVLTDNNIEELSNIEDAKTNFVRIETGSTGVRVFYSNIPIKRFSIKFYTKGARIHLKVIKSDAEIKINNLPLANSSPFFLKTEVDYILEIGGYHLYMMCLLTKNLQQHVPDIQDDK